MNIFGLPKFGMTIQNVFNFNLFSFLNGQDSNFVFILFGICTVLNGPD